MLRAHQARRVAPRAPAREGRPRDVGDPRRQDAGRAHGSARAFKEGKLQVLVATDVAARGLDIDDLPLVVNYELPHVPEDYIHRIGRTGRAGATGEAISFVAPEEEKYLAEIERLLKKKIAVRTLRRIRARVERAERARSARTARTSRAARTQRGNARRANAPRQRATA